MVAILEDFTGYTEADPGTHISKTANHIDHQNYLNEDAMVYYDPGSAIYGNFIFKWTGKWVSDDGGTAFLAAPMICLSTTFDDARALTRNTYNSIVTRFRQRTGGSETIDLIVTTAGVAGTFTYEPGTAILGNTYYFTLTRGGSTVTLHIFSDSARTTLLSTLTGSQATTHRYLYATNSWNSGAANWLDEDVDDLNIGNEYLEVFAEFEISSGTPASVDLFAEFEVQHTATKDLFAQFEAQATKNLFAEITVQNYRIQGTTYDKNGAALVSVTVKVFKSQDDSYWGSVTSDAGTGAYDITGLENTDYYLIHRKGSVWGTSDDITPSPI